MISTIKSKKQIFKYHKDTIEENGVGIQISREYYIDDKLNSDAVINRAVDKYYNELKLAKTPASIDNLVIIDRSGNKYSLYLVELKSVSKLKNIDIASIKSKFASSINDFMETRFSDCFCKQDTKLADLNLWLVCNKFKLMGKEVSDEDYKKRIKNTITEKLLLVTPFRFRERVATIQSIDSGVTIY